MNCVSELHAWNTQLIKNIFALQSNPNAVFKRYTPVSISPASHIPAIPDGEPRPTVFKPLRDNVLLIPAVAPDKVGVLFVPDNAKQAPLKGRVVSVGPMATQVKVGDEVLFEKFAGTDLNLNDVVHLLLGEDNIVGVVETESFDGSSADGGDGLS